jgi:glycerol uptake operon antiterminator
MGRFEREPLSRMLERNRVIPAAKNDLELKKALVTQHDVVFILYGDLVSLEPNVHTILKHDKMPFIHLDMIQGLASNPAALDYFYRHFQRDCGVITTKTHMVKKALELGIRVVQRFFILDSLSLESAIEALGRVRADAVEIMPGIIPRAIAYISRQTNVPIIAGGLVQTPTDVEKILASGAVAVSTTRGELWSMLPVAGAAGAKIIFETR